MRADKLYDFFLFLGELFLGEDALELCNSFIKPKRKDIQMRVCSRSHTVHDVFCALKIGKDTFFFQTHTEEQNSSIKLNMTSTLTSLLLTENRRLTAQVWYPAVLFSLL